MVSEEFYKQIEKNEKAVKGNKSAKKSIDKIIPYKVKTAAESEIEFKSLLSIKTANKWLDLAKQRPALKKLMGDIWSEGELCILFADTNVGKSILAVQLADSICKGQNIGDLEIEVEPQKVIVFDFESSDKQFEVRYSVSDGELLTKHYPFSENLYRAEINPDSFVPDYFDSFEDYLYRSIELAIAETESRILIIDNITYLRSETEKARDALPLMKELKRLKNRFDLSILVLAHTPKRDSSKPISRNDLQGSKMLINFCDSAFAIGESMKDKNLRYIKQIKVRNTEAVFTSDNVLLCQIVKPDNFLHFEFLETASEKEHLRNQTGNDRNELVQKAKEMSESGLSQREIGSQLGISPMTVSRYIKKAEDINPPVTSF